MINSKATNVTHHEKRRHILVAGWFGSGNVGDEAILCGEIPLLLQAFPDAAIEVIIFSETPPIDTLHLYGSDIRWVRMVRAKLWWPPQWFGLFQSLKRACLVVVGGGGLFQDVYNYRAVTFFSGVTLVASVLGKKTIFFAAGLGPLRTKLGKLLCRMALSRACHISLRDQQSGSLLESLGLRKAYEVVGDPVLNIEAPTVPEKSVGVRVGVSVHNLFPWPRASRRNLAKILDRLAMERGAEIVFLPFGWYPVSGKGPADINPSLEIMSLMQAEAVLLDRQPSPHEMIRRISELNLMISMRFHGIVMAALCGVPAMALTFQQEVKLRHFMERLSAGHLVFNAGALDVERFFASANTLLFNQGHTLHAERVVSETRHGFQKLIVHLRNLMEPT